MHFFILLCHTSMHCWKDFSGIPCSSVVTALFMASSPSKWVPLMIPLCLWKRKKSHKQDQKNRGFVSVRWCSSRLRTAGCSPHPVPSIFRHSQIFSDYLPNTIHFFYVRLTCNHSNRQPTIASLHLPCPFDIDLSPTCWWPPTPAIIFHFPVPFFKPRLPLENTVDTLSDR